MQRHYLDGVEVTTPINYAEIEIELNYDKDGNSQSVSTNKWEWGVGDGRDTGDGYLKIQKHIDDGLTTGNGVFVGIPHKIIIDGQRGTEHAIFDGYCDTGTIEHAHDRITATSTEKGGLDWLNSVADSVSFAHLEQLGYINSSDYIQVPYCMNKKQSAIDVIVTIVTIFVVVDKIKEQINVILEMTSEGGNTFEATVIIRLILRILYIIIMIVSLLGLIVSLYNMVVQPVKYHAAMYVYKQLEKGLKYFGLTLSSSILQKAPYNQMALLPEKYQQVENTGIFAGVQGLLKPSTKETGYYNGTVGDLLRSMQDVFNAKIIIDKETNTLYFEKFNFAIAKPIYQLPDVFDARYKYTFNIEECYSNIVLSFATDSQDRNTIQEYFGTSVQITTSIRGTVDPQLVLLKNLYEKRFQFALGKRKTELNVMEKIMDAFYKSMGPIIELMIIVINLIIIVINILIQIVNALIKSLSLVGIIINFQIKLVEPIEVSAFKSLVEGRINMLVMESDYVAIPKLIMVPMGNSRSNTLLPNNEQALSARYLWDNYHYFLSFIGRKDWPGNQFLKQNIDKIPFTYADYEAVRINNQVNDYNGNSLTLLSLKYNLSKGSASGTSKMQQVYVNNLTETIYEPS